MLRRLIYISLIWCLACIAAPLTGRSQRIDPGDLSAKEIARIDLPAVALVICDGRTPERYTLASGFFIKPGVLVTNYHVIRGNTQGIVQVAVGAEKKKTPFTITEVIASDAVADIALLNVPDAADANIPYLSLADSDQPIEIGETIYALGNPEGLVGTISPGIISASQRLTDRNARIQMTAPISPGSSGGPIVNTKGQVVGVAVGSFKSGQNLNFAVPVGLVVDLMNRSDESDRRPFSGVVSAAEPVKRTSPLSTSFRRVYRGYSHKPNGDLPLILSLTRTRGTLSGTAETPGDSDDLKGTIRSDRSFSLIGYNARAGRVTGVWKGIIDGEGYVSGIWTSTGNRRRRSQIRFTARLVR